MLKGSCACGSITYVIHSGLIAPVDHCHCWRCRKHSGASFGTTAGIKAADFEILAGKERLSSWESSPGVHRYFASCCGSPIYKQSKHNPEELGFRLGTLDTDPGVKVTMHFMLGSKAPWIDIDDDFEKHVGGAPFGEKD